LHSKTLAKSLLNCIPLWNSFLNFSKLFAPGENTKVVFSSLVESCKAYSRHSFNESNSFNLSNLRLFFNFSVALPDNKINLSDEIFFERNSPNFS
jgi:hypothetical protein